MPAAATAYPRLRRAKSWVDLAAAALCLWAAWTHTPPGALLHTVTAWVTGTRAPGRPLLGYYSSGLYRVATASVAAPVAPPAPIPQSEALSWGAYAALRAAPEKPKAQAIAIAAARGAVTARLDSPRSGPAELKRVLSGLEAELGSDAAAAVALFCGEEEARYATARARARGDAPTLEALARALPPELRERVGLAGQALALGTAYGLAWPVAESARITSGFGPRRHPTLGTTRLHTGVDLGLPIGTPVHATGRATVRRASYDDVNGHVLVLDHGHGISTVYCHNDALLVRGGAPVGAGSVISKSGNSGRSSGPHLHYQVEVGGTPVDPLAFRPARRAVSPVAVGGTDL